jgi:flagellar biosynthesis protein FlhG
VSGAVRISPGAGHGAQSAPADQAARLRLLMGGTLGGGTPAGQDQRSTGGQEALAVEREGLQWPSERTQTLGPKVICVTSGKGGVGKSNLAVNLCVVLAGAGARTLLIDLDLGLANADVLCGLSPRSRLDANLEAGTPLHELAVDAPGGFKLIAGSVGLGRLTELPEDQRRRLLHAARGLSGACDVLVLDTGAGIGPMVRQAAASADVTLLVATPEPTSIADAYALVKGLWQQSRRTGTALRVPRLVVNQVSGADEAREVHGRISAVAQRFLGTGVTLAGWVPTDVRVGQSVRARIPFAIAHPNAPASAAVELLGKSLRDELLPGRAAAVLANGSVGASATRGQPPGGYAGDRAGVLSKLGRLLAGRV